MTKIVAAVLAAAAALAAANHLGTCKPKHDPRRPPTYCATPAPTPMPPVP